MQSENPRTPGPRICALRIQNGSNNILLDNVNEDSFSGENNMVTPIVYTRRSKFLDEELDDDKDITTGCELAVEKPLEISMVMNNLNSNCISNNINNINVIDTIEIDSKLPSDIKKLNDSHDAISDDSKKLINICKSPGGNIISNNNNNNSDNANIIYNSISINHDVKNKLYLNPNNKRCGDKLESDTLNSKSLTQSSSISSELDLQESALLRRQQLSRVAEWVQNNSNIIVNNNNNINSDDTVNRTASLLISQPPPPLLTTTSSTTMTIPSNHLINLNNNVNSIVDSDNVNENFVNLLNACKIHNNNNNINNNNDIVLPNDSNDNIAIAGNNMYKISDVRKELENQTNFQIAQNINNNEQYLDSCKQMKNFNNNMNNANEQQQVDIAQMEYNVKQFLLKQNEWSMSNKRSSLTTTASTTPVRKQFHRTETNL